MSWSACLRRSVTDKLGPPVSARPVVSYTINWDVILPPPVGWVDVHPEITPPSNFHQLQDTTSAFVDHYNNHRYHESLANLTPADVYHGRGAKILKIREEIKKQTIRRRRLQHQTAAA
nr:integrase core domain-containing protein [Tropicibacter alexandrii]